MKRALLFALVTGLVFCGCDDKKDKPSSPVEVVKVIEGLNLPECLVIDPATGDIYVSNVVTDHEGYWENDSNGFISKLSPDGEIKKLRWLEGSDAMEINAPKGMCILKGFLYFNDNDTLKYCPLDDPETVKTIDIPGAEKLNDLATDGENLWVTDTGAGKVYRIDSSKNVTTSCDLEEVNGVTCFKGKVYAVSWSLHEVYELDPEGNMKPEPFGLAENFLSLDCIEVLDDGSFIVTDWKGNAVYSISADAKTVKKLMEIESAADCALDRENNILYVPAMLKSRAYILKIKK